MTYKFSNPKSQVLIAAHSEGLLYQLYSAFSVDAYYCTIGSALAGRRFIKAIIFPNTYPHSIAERVSQKDWIINVKCKLPPEGELFIL